MFILRDSVGSSAPRQRGWFSHAVGPSTTRSVGPAPAGVVRVVASWRHGPASRPRASGGGSWLTLPAAGVEESAPRQRGWFATPSRSGSSANVGPAPAGVVRRADGAHDRVSGRPRASGGGSARRAARPPRRSSAPRQRGWFRAGQRLGTGPEVGPAPAGVVPAGAASGRSRRRRPRASGGGSRSVVSCSRSHASAPRQRGWFGALRVVTPRSAVGPAPAGVVRRSRGARARCRCRPRASGGGSA